MSKRFLGVCLLAGLLGAAPGGANPIAKVSQSGESLDWEQDGQVVKDYLPLYRSAGSRYFSAGVGLEERAASYPPFSLKIVFTAGGKPYLSGVSVTVQPATGGAALVIPRENVQGPWLFLDLSPGLYDISAADGGHSQQLKRIKVEAGKQQVLYLRWTEDYGVAGRAPAE